MWGKLISLSRNSVGNATPQFPPHFSRISQITKWFLLIPQFPVQFSIQLHKCTSSLHALGLLHAYYMYLWKWGFHIRLDKEFWFVSTHFPRCEIHFPPLISAVAIVKTETRIPFHLSPSLPTSFNCTILYLEQILLPAEIIFPVGKMPCSLDKSWENHNIKI